MQKSEIDRKRRDFLVALSFIAAGLPHGRFLMKPATAAPANREEVELAVKAEVAAYRFGNIPEADFQSKFGALSFLMAQRKFSTNDALGIARQIASGSQHLQTDSFIAGLRDTFANSANATDLLLHTSDGLGFDGVVNSSAGLALIVAGALAKSLPTSNRFNLFMHNLPVLPNTDFAVKLAVAGLLGSTSDSVHSIINDPQFHDLLPTFIPKGDLDTIRSHLPLHARELVKTIFDKGFGDKQGLTTALTEYRKAVLDWGHRYYERATDRLRNAGACDSVTGPNLTAPCFVAPGGTSFNRAKEDMRSAMADINAVRAVGYYTLKELGDARAEQFSKGMQVASLVMNIGLVAATGGVGIVAMAGSLASGLSALRGASADAGGPSGFELISAQIENLRREMHARFDRMEDLERRALSMLFDIAQNLNSLQVSLNTRLTRLENMIAERRNDDFVRERDRLSNAFTRGLSRAKRAIELDRGQTKSPDGDKIDILTFFLDHANEFSGNAVLISNRANPIPAEIRNAERLDFAVGQLRSAAQLLNLKGAVEIDQNPIEWARGVQAYIEAHSMLSVASSTVRTKAEKAWDIGHTMRNTITSLCTRENLRIAMNTYREASDAVRKHLLTSLERTFPPATAQRPPVPKQHPPHVGAFEVPLPSMAYSLGQDGKQYPASYARYLIDKREPALFFQYWGCLIVERDPILLARDAGVITLEDDSAPVPWTVSILNKDVQSRVGISKTVSIKNRRSETIGKLKIIEFDLTPFFGDPRMPKKERLIDLTSTDKDGKPEFRQLISGIWNALYKEFDDSTELLRWIEGLDDKDPVISRYNNVAAAFALYMTLMAWRITDQLDHPWYSGISSQMLRSVDDIKIELSNIARGMSRSYASLLNPMRLSEHRDNISGTEDATVYMSTAKLFTSSEDRDGKSWRDLKALMYFPTLMNTVIANHVDNTLAAAEKLGAELAENDPVDFVDSHLGKLAAFLSLQST